MTIYFFSVSFVAPILQPGGLIMPDASLSSTSEVPDVLRRALHQRFRKPLPDFTAFVHELVVLFLITNGGFTFPRRCASLPEDSRRQTSTSTPCQCPGASSRSYRKPKPLPGCKEYPPSSAAPRRRFAASTISGYGFEVWQIIQLEFSNCLPALFFRSSGSKSVSYV